MRAEAKICPVTPRRTRLLIPARKKDEGFFAEVVELLQNCPGVDGVRANPLTGSVLVEHERTLDQIVAALRHRDHDKLEIAFLPPPEPLSKVANRTIKRSVNTFDKRIFKWTGGQLDFSSVAGLTLLGLAAWQLSRVQFLPAGLTMLILAYRLSHERPPDGMAVSS